MPLPTVRPAKAETAQGQDHVCGGCGVLEELDQAPGAQLPSSLPSKAPSQRSPPPSPPRLVQLEGDRQSCASVLDIVRLQHLKEDPLFVAVSEKVGKQGMSLGLLASEEHYLTMFGPRAECRSSLSPKDGGKECLLLRYAPEKVTEAEKMADALLTLFDETVIYDAYPAAKEAIHGSCEEDRLATEGWGNNHRSGQASGASTGSQAVVSVMATHQAVAKGENAIHANGVALLGGNGEELVCHSVSVVAMNHAGELVEGCTSYFKVTQEVAARGEYQLVSSAIEVAVQHEGIFSFHLDEQSQDKASDQNKVLRNPPAKDNPEHYTTIGWIQSHLPEENGDKTRLQGAVIKYNGQIGMEYAQAVPGKFDDKALRLRTAAVAERKEEDGRKTMIPEVVILLGQVVLKQAWCGSAATKFVRVLQDADNA